jgi:GAF domain-containing protein
MAALTPLPVDAGSAGYVFSSGQPLAVHLVGADPAPWAGIHPLTGRAPESILAVPCVSGVELVGVLELIDKTTAFSYDDVELATLLGGIAGVAITEATDLGIAVADPQELGRELVELWTDDPVRYARLAMEIGWLLADG